MYKKTFVVDEKTPSIHYTNFDNGPDNILDWNPAPKSVCRRATLTF